MTREEHAGLCGWDLLDRNGLCQKRFVPGYFVLLRCVAQCIGKILGSGVRSFELQSRLHCILVFLILAYLSEPWFPHLEG